jgi:hypothetical protein
MPTTSDPNDPRLTCGVDDHAGPQAEAYLVLSDEERAKGFVRPLRTAYQHVTCGAITTMNQAIAETYAANPGFYGATYCTNCHKHLPVGERGDFVWVENGKPTNLKVGA